MGRYADRQVQPDPAESSGRLNAIRDDLVVAADHLLSRDFNAFVEIFGEVDKMYASRGFLAYFNTNKRKGDLSAGNLLDKLRRIEMRKIIAANLIDRDDGLATILSHQ